MTELKAAPILTLSMIVKNEEKYLEECLDSIKDLADEIVIVDTGSTDKTVEIAKKFNAKIYDFNWINDFSAARNFALSKSNGKWILYLDADERLKADSISLLKNHINNSNNAALCNVISLGSSQGSSNIMQYARLFPNNKSLQFEGAVHEQIEPALIKNGYLLEKTKIEIIHLGYDVNNNILIEKAKRNLELLLKDYLKNPSGYKAFHIGSTFIVLNEFEKAINYFHEAIKDERLESNHKAHCYRYLAAYELNVSKNIDNALSYAVDGCKLNAKQPLLNVILSNIYLYKGEFRESEKYCNLAYKYNIEAKEDSLNSFEIIIEETLLLQHIVNISVLTVNRNLFNEYYKKLLNFEIEKKWKDIFEFFNGLFTDTIVEESLVADVIKDVTNEYLDAVNVLIQSYNNIESKLMILENLKKLNPTNLGVLFNYGDLLFRLEKDDEALNVFNAYYELDKSNPLVINSLIALNFKLNKLNNLHELLESAIEVFKNDNEIVIKLTALKQKLQNILLQNG